MEKQKIMGYMFSRCSRSYKRAINQALEKYNLTIVQCGIIRTLKHSGKLSQAEIAEIYSSDKATIGSVIKILMEKDYLQKEQSKSDKRAYVVSLTPKADSIADEIEEISKEIERQALQGLCDDEINVFYRVMSKIIENLDSEES